ncbi:Wzz/FepE/Etk N-terminal domain-containing protein [Rhodococcus sp. NPDC003382]|uniref:Wzz/FepE/Etk N-terminal domain-containing protein n=1 Tax=unclassified Rhodococcus (in: high G+C Gram-positive bacteria) TaxID=192944 RepID=UPI0018CF8FE0|nr:MULTISPECIES: Wzz/FepE/Etk N-terminal domain-containing protein [unclassified Rhodococcus (in: high G+C Gram-positive bacteria)]MBH0121120.1 hypothetical protein [Rhodococcus sp. CX]MCK8672780.1 Wzz/FepE/Etk N-terminal domain-containing protein [Rhodococcus sp. HM1]
MTGPIAEYVRVLRERWRWLVWGALLALAATTLFLFIRPPLYRYDATVFVRTPGDVSRVLDGGDSYAQGRARTYAALARSNDLAARVVADLGLEVTPTELSERVTAHNPSGTALIDFEFGARSPTEADRIATVLLSELAATVRTLESVPGSLVPRAELVVVDTPTPAARVVFLGATVPVTLLAAAVAGLVLGATAAVLRSLFDRSIRDPLDAARISGRPLIGSIRGGPADELTPEVRAILHRLLAALPQPGRGVITVVGAGPGPTTSDSAVALASVFTAHGDSVVLVDLDFRDADSTSLLSGLDVPGISDLARGDAAASNAVVRTPAGDFVGVGTTPGDLGSPAASAALRSTLHELRELYAFVVLACPSVTTAATIEAESDVAVLAVRENATTEEQLRQVSPLLPANTVVLFDARARSNSIRKSEADKRIEATD